MVRRIVFAAVFEVILIAIPSWAIALQSVDVPPEFRTIAESSEYAATCMSEDCVAFLERCDANSDLVTAFEFGKTVEGKPMSGVIISRGQFQIGIADDRFRVLVIGNIHSGECDGKEALLEIVRNIALDPSREPYSGWLEKLVIVVVPNYNADGNDKMARTNRPGQVGPSNGMGVRANAQQFDLNRDFVKLDSAEAQNLIGLFSKYDPHLFIDCHTTNGSKHQYVLTYDIPHNPNCPEPIRETMRSKMMPLVTQRLEAMGMRTFYYGNFDRRGERWETYGFEPRYSIEYAGVRGRMGILSESYSYASYKERIDASRDFVSACLTYAAENAPFLKQVVESCQSDTIAAAKSRPETVQITLDAKMAPFDKRELIRAFRDGAAIDIEVEFWGDYQPISTAAMPAAYSIPENLSAVVSKLRQHGVDVEQLSQDIDAPVEVELIKSINRSTQQFQKHNLVRLTTNVSTATRTLPAGSYLVRTGQPLGRLGCVLLEARSVDGLAAWNFLDDELAIDRDFPILRVLKLPE